jgi:hypothetical protein
MGRTKNNKVWQHFNESEDKSVKCLFCEKLYKKGHISKMTQHLLTCSKCPEVVKKEH